MDEKMKNERSGVLRRQESLPFCSQTEKDRWWRDGRKNERLEVQKSLTNSVSPSIPESLETQSIQLFLVLHHLSSNEVAINLFLHFQLSLFSFIPLLSLCPPASLLNLFFFLLFNCLYHLASFRPHAQLCLPNRK